MVDPEPVTARSGAEDDQFAGGGGDNKVTVETINGNAVPNQEAPRSDAPTASADQPATAPAAQDAAAELKPNDPNELKPNVEPDANALPPLQQSNQLDSGNGTSSLSLRARRRKSRRDGGHFFEQEEEEEGIGKAEPVLELEVTARRPFPAVGDRDWPFSCTVNCL
jgi:hypothetical protein